MNHGFTYTSTLGPAAEGVALAAHLARAYGHSTEAEWRARIEAGLVELDGRPASPEARLHQGQRLSWHRPPWEEPEVPLEAPELFRDADLLAVAKPSGLPTLPGAQFLEHSLLHQVRLRYPEATPVHRLGRGTSGLVLFARHARAGSALCAALRARETFKLYRARVAGAPAEDAFDVSVPIGPVPHGCGTVHAATPAGRPARSVARVLERGDATSLLEVRIETGRPHQIRIHMAAAGYPLAGDPLYAPGGLPRPGALPGDLGYALHALELGFPHPATGRWTQLRCPPPAGLKRSGEA